jgi:hypothetical protein
MATGPATPQHLRAFVQVFKELLEDANARFGRDNVASMLRHVVQLWTSSFGMVNRLRFLRGAADNGTALLSDTPVEPFPLDSRNLPHRHHQTTYRVLNGRPNTPGANFTPCADGAAYEAVCQDRKSLSQKLAETRRTLSVTREQAERMRNEVQLLKVKVEEAVDDAAACRIEINSLVQERGELRNEKAVLVAERDALLAERQAWLAKRAILTGGADLQERDDQIARLSMQVKIAKTTCQNLRADVKATGEQLEAITNLSLQFHTAANATIKDLQSQLADSYTKNVDLANEVNFCKGELHELAEHPPNKEEDSVPYIPCPASPGPTPDVDFSAMSFAGGALMQLARTIRTQMTLSDPDIDPIFESQATFAAPIPEIVAQVLADHNQPQHVINLIASNLSLCSPMFSETFKLLRINPVSPLGQDLTEALKHVLGVENLQ